MSMRLRELIRAVRNAKTAAEERAVISRECANIRTAIKENHPYKARNVSKLMYIHMLGYPTSFGQMECINLINSTKYPEKRIGYLGLMILLDEKQEVLTLVENTLKKDLNDTKNQFVQALALAAIANISSPDICRSLSPEIQKLLNHSPYIRKKAALCAVRIFRKAPELIENFADKMEKLLRNETNHGVLITVIQMIIEICQIQPQYIPEYRKFIPTLLKILKGLLGSMYALEHDAGGVADPFLQVKILRLLRILGQGDSKASEQMNEVLAQVASNTDSNRNAGHAVLYECVMTSMAIEAESGLRGLAITILGKFLVNRDNNIRYVALQTLKQVVGRDAKAVNRHIKTIVECLKDPDISIRKRALDLIYVLVDHNNIRFLVQELLNHLQRTDKELRDDLTTKICTVVEKFAPSTEWKLHTLIKVLVLAGDYMRDDIATGLIGLITQTPEMHQYIVHKLYSEIKKSPHKHSMLLQVGVWCIGEYGDLLLDDDDGKFPKISKEAVIETITNLMHQPFTTPTVQALIITCLSKLGTRFHMEKQVTDIISKYKTSYHVEIQQRSCEFTELYSEKVNDEIRDRVLSKMPAITKQNAFQEVIKKQQQKSTPSVEKKESPKIEKVVVKQAEPPKQTEMQLLDLTNVFGGGSGTTTSQPTQNGPESNTSGNLLDLLTPIEPKSESKKDISTPVLLPVEASQGSTSPNKYLITAFDKNGLIIRLTLSKTNEPFKTHVVATFSNTTQYDITKFDFMVAAPKWIKLFLKKATSPSIPSLTENQVSQQFMLINTLQKEMDLMIKFKIVYTQNGTQFTEIGDVRIPRF